MDKKTFAAKRKTPVVVDKTKAVKVNVPKKTVTKKEKNLFSGSGLGRTTYSDGKKRAT